MIIVVIIIIIIIKIIIIISEIIVNECNWIISMKCLWYCQCSSDMYQVHFEHTLVSCYKD